VLMCIIIVNYSKVEIEKMLLLRKYDAGALPQTDLHTPVFVVRHIVHRLVGNTGFVS